MNLECRWGASLPLPRAVGETGYVSQILLNTRPLV
jgi:hypothetical protein